MSVKPLYYTQYYNSKKESMYYSDTGHACYYCDNTIVAYYNSSNEFTDFHTS